MTKYGTECNACGYKEEIGDQYNDFVINDEFKVVFEQLDLYACPKCGTVKYLGGI